MKTWLSYLKTKKNKHNHSKSGNNPQKSRFMEKNRISNKSKCNIQNRQQVPMKGINKRSLICGQLARATSAVAKLIAKEGKSGCHCYMEMSECSYMK